MYGKGLALTPRAIVTSGFILGSKWWEKGGVPDPRPLKGLSGGWRVKWIQ